MESLPETVTNLRILCIDTERQWLNLMKRELRASGIRDVLEELDPKQALITIRNNAPDLLITNHNLKLIQFIRNGGTSPNRKLPVIMVTEKLSEKDIATMRDKGVNEIVAKPCSISQILKRIESVVIRPRAFIESDDFVGPCRRRKQTQISHSDRRISE